MASKKFKLLLGLLILLGSSAFSQTKGGYNPYDTSVIPSKSLPQQNEFWNNTYSFPAKPRNQWEVGASGGILTESSSISAVLPTFGFGVHVRKAVGYLFSLRLDYTNGYAEGQNWNASSGYVNNVAWAYDPVKNPNGYHPGTDVVYYNYKAHIQDLSAEGLITLNNIRFHKEKSGITMYAGVGFGATIFKVYQNSFGANGQNYAALFNYISANITDKYSNRKQILDALKNGIHTSLVNINGMDNTYETASESDAGTRRPSIGDNTLKPSFSLIGGIEYKVSDKVNIALEDRFVSVKTLLLDGQEWSEYPQGNPALLGQFQTWNYLSLGLNVNMGSKAVEPLWWINPLDYAYSELNNPKHMKLPKPVFDDADGDGVVDQLDREPNTPAGCPVDTHGVSRDTDGDGVPDCKDKQLITPTECQPVDADGVGHCPDPTCCAANKALIDSLIHHPVGPNCPSDYPSISFKDKSIALGKDAKALAATVASKLKSSPTCTITLTAYPGTSKAQQSLAETRLNAVKKYLVEKLGISEDRISTDKVIGGGDEGTIDIKAN